MSNQHRVEPNVDWARLSPLEREIALLVAEGLTNGQIAERLGKASSHIGRVVQILYVKSGVTPPSGESRRRYGDRVRLETWAKTLRDVI